MPSSSPRADRNPHVYLSHTSWFITPSPFKDGAGSEGGTQQGRITCKDHSAQTDPPEIQALRRSRWTHGRLVSMDLSQIELRVAALLSGEPSMVAEYAKPKPDLHTSMTVSLFGADIVHDPNFKNGEPEDPRQWGKTTNFLILFRGQATKLQETLLDSTKKLYPLTFCQQMVSNAWAARPTLWAWQETLIEEARATGRVLLPILGQSRDFAGGTKYDVNEIVNFPVQTTAGNVMVRIQHHILRLIRERSLHKHILMYLNVYDAAYFDCSSPSTAQILAHHIIPAAVQHVATHDYWAHLCHIYSRHVPLIADTKLQEPT